MFMILDTRNGDVVAEFDNRAEAERALADAAADGQGEHFEVVAFEPAEPQGLVVWSGSPLGGEATSWLVDFGDEVDVVSTSSDARYRVTVRVASSDVTRIVRASTETGAQGWTYSAPGTPAETVAATQSLAHGG